MPSYQGSYFERYCMLLVSGTECDAMASLALQSTVMYTSCMGKPHMIDNKHTYEVMGRSEVIVFIAVP